MWLAMLLVVLGAAQDEGGSGLTRIDGIRVGHHTLEERPTGCTVILTVEGAVASVDVRGSAPGTRETDLLDPINTVERVHAIVLSGGSALGLDAASGVVRFLDEREWQPLSPTGSTFFNINTAHDMVEALELAGRLPR